ncbi:UNKNOWN [Stylonychia lemnae]|uniref:Uncharacterized protein n=1 Tax=Stylonychia lemnae TaxID=5949 RepID=A0A078A2B6_STYLE|nr:UNKNOWN [Stylonychia lemnae]|eukprot:CDW74919.1 UNKNOWN [Stylonychia lemnae]
MNSNIYKVPLIILLLVVCSQCTEEQEKRKFNIPSSFSGEGKVYHLGADGKLNATKNFTVTKASVKLNIALSQVGYWEDISSCEQKQVFVEQHLDNFQEKASIIFSGEKKECAMHHIGEGRGVQAVIDGMNNPFEDKNFKYKGFHEAIWDQSQKFYIFNNENEEGEVMMQFYYSDVTGLLRYQVMNRPDSIQVLDMADLFNVNELLTEEDFEIKECIKKDEMEKREQAKKEKEEADEQGKNESQAQSEQQEEKTEF